MKILIIVNDPPYGNDRTYNALRLAVSLSTQNNLELKVFFMGDAAPSAKSGQKVPQGYYNIETMLKSLVKRNVTIGICGSCMDARGIKENEITDGTNRSSLLELTQWTMWADKVITF